ncbi:MAG: Flagellar hook-length control protein FliK [Myxococcaceae bacterium]|nr:Flagellar hook-length control protein FliK [Myxococcaceae bacterium]
MNTLRLSLLALVLSCIASGAAAQRANTIGFEADCAGNPINVIGVQQFNDDLFKDCGLASVNSNGLTGKQQIARNGTIPILTQPIKGITGNNALAGAYSLNTLGPLVIIFSVPVNEVSFDALDLDNASGLSIELDGVNGAPVVPIAHPTADANKALHYALTSVTPILRLTISYVPAQITLGDGWFVDQLSFNTWQCGDGEIDGNAQNPAHEVCDDGNAVQCDGCNNSCQTSISGCFDGTTCVANGATAGCSACDTATPKNSAGEIPTTPRAAGTACDDSLFCTLPGTCDSAGVCQAPVNTCDDSIVCTKDTCDEANDKCLHPVEDKWCLIAGTCFANGAANPSNPCQLCSAATANTAWDAQPVGKLCGNPSCMSGMAVTAASCNASGQCQVPPAELCPLSMCANSASCDGHCVGDFQCPLPMYCDTVGTLCVMDLPPSSTCTRDGQCGSNSCVDGVCCDKVCNAACEACDQAGKLGVCTALPALSVDPESRCNKGQFCSAEGACTTPPPIAPPPPSSPPVEKQPIGASCAGNDGCGSGVCQDGVCCDRACNGACESCAAPDETRGQCTPYALGEDPEHECGGAGAVCNGDSTCTKYETRGNGLCAASPAKRSDRGSDALALGGLLALAVTLASKRRARSALRKPT